MKKTLLAALLVVVTSACSISANAQKDPAGPAPLTVSSPLGFEMQVPNGWGVFRVDDQIIIVESSLGQGAYLYVRMCPSPTGEACLSDHAFPKRLITIRKGVKLGSLPAVEYTFGRESLAHTRAWTELVTVAAVNGKAYAAGVQVSAHFDARRREHYLAAYRAIRDSFKLAR